MPPGSQNNISMMKICVISDIHGSDKWRDIVDREKDNVERFVFLGDYFDSKGMESSPVRELDNLVDIVSFATSHGNVDLLIGNHDYYYLMNGSSFSTREPVYGIISAYLGTLVRQRRLKVAVSYGKYIFSHAGLGTEWMEDQGVKTLDEVNALLYDSPRKLSFVMRDGFDRTGENTYQGPLWIRPYSLQAVALPSHIQVVGHTRTREVFSLGSGDERLIFIDTTMRTYLTVDTDAESETVYQL